MISASIGPNAYEVLSAGSVPCYTATGGTVRETVEAFNQGELQMMGAANADSYSGMARNAADPSENTSGEEDELEMLSARLRDLRGQIAEIHPLRLQQRFTESGKPFTQLSKIDLPDSKGLRTIILQLCNY